MNAEILLENGFWPNNIKDIINSVADAVFSSLKLKHNDIEICFLCTDDEEIKTLNKTYRGIDKPTNVLSFPAEHYKEDDEYLIDSSYEIHAKVPCILGSIALAYETIKKESEEQNKSFDDHLKHMIVHSVLHLLGYDHINDDEAEEMEKLEIKILNSINIKNPYI